MMPDIMPQDLTAKLELLDTLTWAQAAELLEAKRVEAEFKAQAEFNAQRLFDPPGSTYVYRDRY